MKSILSSFAIFCAASSVASAATIVGLAEGAAIYNETGGSGGGATPDGVSDPNHALGLTMNVTFTPDSTDIGQTTNAVALLEIGGNANGTGLYLLGGELYFLSKMQSDNVQVVDSFDDLDFAADGTNTSVNIVGVKTGFLLTAGTEYSVGVVYDPNGASTLDIGVLPTSGSLSQNSWSFSNAGGTNGLWSGNDTVTSFQSPNNAGGGNITVGNPFQEGSNMNALSGTAGQALLWNDLGTIIPEPTTFGLFGLGGLMLILRRRR